MARPFEGFRSLRIADVDREYERRLALGFPLTLPDPETEEPTAETLQFSNENQRLDWVILLGICDEAYLLGAGDLPMTRPLRCTSNREYPMSWNEAAVIIRDMRAWGFSLRENWTRLKDAVRDVTQRPDLYLIDLSEGWP